MKISFFIPSLFNSAGMERISTSLANLLSDRGHNCSFIVLGSNVESFFTLRSSIKIFSLNCKGGVKKNRLRGAVRLRRLLKECNPDVMVNVDVAMIQVAALAFPNQLGIKMISWEQFSMANANGLLPKLKRYVSALCSHRLVVLTEEDRDQYKWFRSKVVCIGNFTTIHENTNESERIKQHNIPSKTVLSVGRLCETKGFDLLLQAWEKIEALHPQWNLRIVGGGDKVALLNQISLNGLQNVEIINPTKHIDTEYKNAAIYVSSSRFEPFGLVLIEAKSFGLPIVSFDCPYGPKEIVKNGIDGLLVNNGDIDEMSQTIISLIENPLKIESFGIMARKDYKLRWSSDSVAEKWEQLLSKSL